MSVQSHTAQDQFLGHINVQIKGECSVFLKNNYIMDENDLLSEYIKIPLRHNRTNGAVYSETNFKVEICSAL